MKKYCLPLFALIAIAFFSCENRKATTEIEEAEPLRIVRIDSYLLDTPDSALPDSLKEALEFIDFIVNQSVTGDSAVWLAYRDTKAFQVFAPDVKERFTCQDSIEKVLGVVDNRLKSTFGDDKGVGKVYGLINPYNVPVVTTDSAVMVGLNHYLGVDYPGYAGFDSYKVRAKRAVHLPYDVAEARIVADFPMETAEEGTLLNKMLYWGAVTYAVTEIVPNADLCEVFNLTPEELEWLEKNYPDVWRTMIERQLLYSTNPDVADRLLDPAPKSYLINAEAPGMTGRYMGYLIVKSFMEKNPGTSLKSLFTPEFYNSESTLINSGFTGS